MSEARLCRWLCAGILVAAAIANLSGCSALSPPPATATATATATPLPTATATASASRTATATFTPTLTATASPSATNTATPTITLTPSVTPHAAPGFIYDNWGNPDIPAQIRDGIDSPMVVMLNNNDRRTISNRATAQPGTGIQTLYFVPPGNPAGRIQILQAESNRELEVFLARRGNALAYVKRDGNPQSDGLYLLDLSAGFSARVLAGENPLAQRGLYMPPDWSPDGAQLAIALETGYATDIFLYAVDGSGRRNLTNSGAFELYPRFSPDGRHLAFVSDREACPSWTPGDADACDATRRRPPAEGKVYVMELASGVTRLAADVTAAEAPRWINERHLAISSGDPLDLLNPQRRIWLADIVSGEARQIRYAGAGETASYLSEAWSPDGRRVLAQIADQGNQLALLGIGGEILASDTDLAFPRFGMAASWSPDGRLLAIGGTAGQCPYGIRIKDADFKSRVSPNPPPSMCDPIFSPDGQRIAFSGVDASRSDGRNHVYVVGANGFGRLNLSASLYGTVDLLGWVGGSP